MKILSLHLKNFRTYGDAEIVFNERLCFITGNNAAGKTNILEAITLLSNGRSFRNAGDAELIRIGNSGYHIACRYESEGSLHSVEYGFDTSTGRPRRKLKLDGKTLGSRTALIGKLLCVVFSPSDLAIVDGGPTMRRRFMDMVISHQNHEYLMKLIQYNRSIKQRNVILKNIRKNRARLHDLDPWNQSLLSLEQFLTKTRYEFIEKFSLIFQQSLDRISDKNDRIFLKLETGIPSDSTFPREIERSAMRDVAAGFTTVGPHRHTLHFINETGGEITNYISQGQKRSIVISLKIAQFDYLKKLLNVSPLLIIDDVIRELDAGRRSAFVELLHECGQAIFTTPDMDGLEGFVEDTRSQFEIMRVVSRGVIEVEKRS